MKKFTLFILSLFFVVGAMAQIQVSTSVETPDNVYAICSSAGHYMSSCTGATKYRFGRFAFYATEKENTYKIFSVDANKWVSYTKADSYGDGTNKAVLVDSQEAAEAWRVTENGSYYNFAPFRNDGDVAVRYWNFFGGAGASGKPYNYDATDKTVGFYNDKNDGGSKWSLELVNTLATEEQVNAAKALIVVAPGYPKTTSPEYKAIDALAYNASTTSKHVEIAVAAYKTTSDVILPEDGKAYAFTSVMGNGVKRYMKYENGKKVSVVAVDGNEPSVFVCKQLRAGVYVFVAEDGCLLTWVGNNENGAYKENGNIYGYSTYYATTCNGKSDWNEVTVKKNGTAANDFGYLRLVARRHSSSTSSFIVNKGNRFDQSSDTYYFNNDNSSAWIVTEVEHTNTDAQNVAIAKIAAKETYKNHEFGANVGQYYLNGDEKIYDKAAFISMLDAKTTVEDVEALDIKLNMPVTGKYYTFKNDDYYITSGVTNAGRIALNTTKDATAIYYFDGSHLLAYTTGLYFGLNANDWTFEAIGSKDISAIEFVVAVNGAVGKYNIKSGGRWLHRTEAYVNRCTNNTCGNAHNWTIEEVESLPVTISAAKYATFYAPVAVAVPTDVTAYTVTINGEWATLNEIEGGVIPANTGVVLYSESAATYNFDITENVVAINDNALRGSAAATYYTAAGTYYALSIVEGVVGFYKDKFNNSRFQNNSHKAYLYVEGTQNTASYSFRFPDTTGVEDVVVENEVKTIFDLTGRKVESITAPGIYIVNGKKVLVK